MQRSLLFVPGDSERKLEKSRLSAADILIVDLEDSVAPANKPQARTLAARFATAGCENKQIYIRVNALDTNQTLEDLRAVLPSRPAGIMLPKCRSADDVEVVSRWLEAMEVVHDIEVGTTKVIPIVTETAESVMHLRSYMRPNDRVWGLLWGAEDLAGDIGASTNRSDGAYRSSFRWVREQFLFAAKAAALIAIDAVYVDVRDPVGLVEEASQARIDGFEAKAAVHPDQCALINAAFAPSEAERVWAERVMASLREADTAGVSTLDGKMIDKPHIAQAEKILARAQLTA